MNLKSLIIAGLLGLAVLASSPSVDTKQAASVAKPVAKPAVPPSAEKVEAIKKLLAITRAVEGNLEPTRAALKAMMKNSPNVNPAFWPELEKRANAYAFEQILVSIYDHNYSLEEIKGLTQFYESPVGKAFLEKDGKVLSESGHNLQAYMEYHSKELMKKYAEAAPKAEPKKK